ncbi:MAG: Uma2 family endonuclease [Polyangiaceae bacterium]
MPLSSPEVLPSVRPLRRVEYDQLVGLGAFTDERIELLDGVLVPVSPIGGRHSRTVGRLGELLVVAMVGKACVLVQSPFAAGDLSEPEPDLSVSPLSGDDDVHPEQAHLIVEVAESSVSIDRGRKARLYAECRVPEYWVVNLVARHVEVYTEPVGGVYQRVTVYEKGSRIRLEEFPELHIAVDDFLK